jgi:hypothetical protein
MPDLTDVHKFTRIPFAGDKVDNELRSYDDFLNSIHMDKKWFFLNEEHLSLDGSYCSNLEVTEFTAPFLAPRPHSPGY